MEEARDLSNLTAVGRLRHDPLQFLSAFAGETPLARRTIGQRPIVFAIAPEAAREALVTGQRELTPARFIGRLAVTDTELAGEPVREGSVVLVSPYLLHRDERQYADPTVFDAGRWVDGTSAAARTFTFLPFGAGPRRCIGEEIAWLEASAILVTLARAFEFELIGAPDLTPFPGASLRPAGHVRLRLRPRLLPAGVASDDLHRTSSPDRCTAPPAAVVPPAARSADIAARGERERAEPERRRPRDQDCAACSG